MKREIIFLLCMVVSIITFGQNQDQKLLEEVKVTPPKFVGSVLAMDHLDHKEDGSVEAHMKGIIQYPEEALRRYAEGTEVVQFTVTTKGEVTNFTIINSVSPEFDDEVIRALKTTNGMWKPGSNNGEPVAMEKELSISFKIDDSEDQNFSNLNDFKEDAQRYFSKGSILLLMKDKPKRALSFYDKGILLLPNEANLLLMRGLTKYELNDKEGACSDWNRLKALGGLSSDIYLENYCEMKGYAELIRVLEE